MQKTQKTGILLINLGTPDSSKTKDVRKYLREFLTDPLVIQIPAIPRWILVNCIIAPFRAKKSAHAYKQIWDPIKGSPLKYHTEALTNKIAKIANMPVTYAMRYQNPSIQKSIQDLLDKNKNIDNLIILPLFPQYSEAASESAIAKAEQVISKNFPEIKSYKIIKEFYNHPAFINSLSDLLIKQINNLEFKPDYYIFSFHGLPEQQLDSKTLDNHCKNLCSRKSACPEISDKNQNKNCYRAQCYATTELLYKKLQSKLKINKSKIITCFQSRLGKTKWIEPYLDDVLVDLANKKAKNIFISCPSFVADCLETLEEIGMQAKETWVNLGGENLFCAMCLNQDDNFSSAIKLMIMPHLNS